MLKRGSQALSDQPPKSILKFHSALSLESTVEKYGRIAFTDISFHHFAGLYTPDSTS